MWVFTTTALLFALIHSGYPQSAILNECECGKQSNEGIIILNFSGQRIVNGTEVRPHKYPWMTVMMKGWQHICGGAIISDRNILTAGHCVYYIPYPKTTKWIVGTHSIQANSRNSPNTYKTSDYQLHPYFTAGKMFDNYDMALIVTDRQIMFSPTISPICLPAPGEENPFFDTQVTVAGWGRVSEYGAPTDTLMETQVWLKSQQECRVLTDGIQYDESSMLCAHELYTDACQGDSGGPLFTEKSPNHYVILGIVSFGDGCARDFPGIYTRVGEENTLTWIYRGITASKANLCRAPGTIITA